MKDKIVDSYCSFTVLVNDWALVTEGSRTLIACLNRGAEKFSDWLMYGLLMIKITVVQILLS